MTTNAIHSADVRVVPDWELCDRLRRSMRLVPGLNNEDIADMMGVQRTTVSTWLGGRRVPNRAVLLVWADMTGVDEQWLITGKPSDQSLYAMRDLNPQPADWDPRRPALRLLGGPRIIRPVPVKPRLTLVGSVA